MAKKPPTKPFVPKTPFYYQLTPVRETYKDAFGVDKQIDLPLVTLPPGTLLFRGVKIPHPSEGEDVRYFYRDYLGDPEPDGRMCLSPVHNVFFYPFPFVAFGAHNIGETFQSMKLVVLVHPVTFICAISPSPLVRGTPHGLDGTAPWQRCARYSFECHQPSLKELDAKDFDNCIDPSYQARSGVHGWMAIADLDSLQPRKLIKKGIPAKEVPMSKYLYHLESVFPGKAAELLACTYTDLHKHSGYPELAIYPYKIHPGPRKIVHGVRTSKKAISIIEKEVQKNNLNFLPLAVFTKDATIDMVNGKFMWESLGIAKNSFATPPVEHQLPIEKRLNEYLDFLQSSGVELPFYGKGKLSFDSRTGFYVLPQLVPSNYRVPVPDNEKSVPYSNLLMPLDTSDNRKKVLSYMLMFRTPIPQKFMEKYGLEKGFTVRRAMIFSRPPVLSKLFEALDLPLPGSYKATLARAAKQYQQNTGVLSKAQQERLKTQEEAKTLEVKEEEAPQSPQYGSVTPPVQNSNLKGGYTRRKVLKKKSSKTRKSSKKPFLHFATDFKQIWNLHAKFLTSK